MGLTLRLPALNGYRRDRRINALTFSRTCYITTSQNYPLNSIDVLNRFSSDQMVVSTHGLPLWYQTVYNYPAEIYVNTDSPSFELPRCHHSSELWPHGYRIYVLMDSLSLSHIFQGHLDDHALRGHQDGGSCTYHRLQQWCQTFYNHDNVPANLWVITP